MPLDPDLFGESKMNSLDSSSSAVVHHGQEMTVPVTVEESMVRQEFV